MTSIITFFTEKGGTGKTTFNILMSSYLSYIKSKSLLYVDCDFPSYHAFNIRQREIRQYEESPDMYNKKNLHISGNAFGLEKIDNINDDSSMLRFLTQLTSIKKKGIYDFIIIDMPGSMNGIGINKVLASRIIDHYFILLENDRQTIVSDIQLGLAIQKTGSSVSMFWNKVYPRENREIYERHTAAIRHYGLDVLPTMIGNTVTLRRESLDNTNFLRSTLSYSDQHNKNNITLLLESIYAKIIR